MFNDTNELHIDEDLRSRISGFKGQLDEQAAVMMWGSPQPQPSAGHSTSADPDWPTKQRGGAASDASIDD